MIPTGERLDRDHRAGLEVDDRLVVDVDLVALDGPLERGDELLPMPDAGVHLGLVERVTALAAVLRAVHRDVRIPEQLVGRRRARTPTAIPTLAWTRHLPAVDRERRLERSDEPLGDPLRLAGACRRA